MFDPGLLQKPTTKINKQWLSLRVLPEQTTSKHWSRPEKNKAHNRKYNVLDTNVVLTNQMLSSVCMCIVPLLHVRARSICRKEIQLYTMKLVSVTLIIAELNYGENSMLLDSRWL